MINDSHHDSAEENIPPTAPPSTGHLAAASTDEPIPSAPDTRATLPPVKTAAPVGGLPGYQVLAELGRGAMGVVYHARQVALKRDVAVKMILAGEHAGEQDRRRFLAEAEVVAAP